MSDIAKRLQDLQDLIDALNAGSPGPALKGGKALAIEPIDVVYREEHIRRAVKKKGCPKCGHEGKFVRMALCCPQHGAFGGC